MRAFALATALSALASAAPPPLAAQGTVERLLASVPAGPILAPALRPASAAPDDPSRQDGSEGHVAPKAALYSLVLPGAGQFAQGQRRWVAYAGLEALAWLVHLDRRDSGLDFRDEYRALAWEVARGMQGPRVVDDFEYYERLSNWGTSGAWDAEPQVEGVQPETDPLTYNGAIWRRATDIFFGSDQTVGPGDPRWDEALEYYRDRAYPPDLLWSWEGNPGARNDFGRLVRESDDHLREATVMIGVILANHVLSAADAFVSARLGERTGGRVDGGLAWIPPGLPEGAGRGLLTLTLRVRP